MWCMNLESYLLYIGLILCVLGILMRAHRLDFIIGRYEGFHKVIRKKTLSVDREGLSKYYSNLFLILGSILLIAAIIHLIKPEISELITLWIYVAVLVVGIIGILYCNLTNRFLKYD